MTRGETPGVWFCVTFFKPWPHYSVNKRNSQGFVYTLFTFVSMHKRNRGDLVFYHNFVNLCNKKGVSPSAAAEDMGYQRSVVTRWSKGTEPRQATLQRVADYFGVSVSELISEQKEKPTLQAESEPFDGYSDLTDEELEKVKEYAAFLLASRNKK